MSEPEYPVLKMQADLDRPMYTLAIRIGVMPAAPGVVQITVDFLGN